MPRFITVTEISTLGGDREVWVNVDRIVTIRPGEDDQAHLLVDGGPAAEHMTVRGTPSGIHNKINDA